MGTVTKLVAEKPIPDERDAALRRRALQIVAELPEDEGEALAVLEHAKTLVRSFLARSRPV